MARPAARRLEPVPVTVVDKDEDAEALNDAPLFEVSDEKKIASVLVRRMDPDEGTLGTMPPEITELEIKRRWGGGTFQLQARDERNKPLKGGHRTIQIAGDPLFESKAAQAKWKRQQQIDDAPPAGAGGDAIGLKDIIAILSSTESKATAAAALRFEEQDRQHKREIERLRIEGELRAEERKADDERRERAQLEREERRRKEDEEREERRRKDDESARQRDREFQVMLASLTKKGGADGADMLLKGISLARDLGGGGGDSPTDPVTAVAAALLPTLLGGRAPAGAPGLVPPAAAAAPPAAPGDEPVTFDGALGKKTLAVVQHLQAQGYDPEAAIAGVWDTLLKVKKPTAPAAPAPPAPSLAAAGDAPKATPPAKRRTTKK
jgi:hypothetical protein